MDDTSCLTNSLLNLDTAQLEAVLLRISQTLKCHEAVVSKLPQVETAQCDLRKDLNKLRLAFKSASTPGCDDDITVDAVDSANESKTCDRADAPSQVRNHLYAESQSNAGKSSSYGVRKGDIEPIHLKHADELSNANDQAIANGLREIKSAIRRLQQDRDEGLVNSMELDESIKTLRENLFEIQQKLTSSASTQQLQTLHRSLIAKYGEMERNLQAFKSNFHEEVDKNISHTLSDVKSWFKDLESLVKQRQGKLEQRVASCAREYDVAAFRGGIESDVESLTRKTSFLDDTAKAQGRTIVMLQQKNAIAMFHRHYTNWKRNALMTGVSRWKQVVKHQLQYEDGKESQKRLVRKVLTNIMSRRKRFGFERWIRYRDWHRKMERLKLKASTLICERMGLYLSAPKTMAFNRWRRLTLIDKMKCSREADVVEEENGRLFPSAPPTTIKRMEAGFDMNSILDSFRGDVQGATYALAQEIESIKSHDIASLRQDWCTENQRLTSTIRTTMDEAIQRVEDTADTFQDTMNDRVDGCTNDLPVVHSKLNELSDLLESSRTDLKSLEEGHTKRIDTLFEKEQQLEHRLSVVEDQTKAAAHEITSLFEEQANSSESIQHLRDVIAKNDERHEEERLIFQQALDHFGNELLKTKVTLGHTQVRCESLESELAEAKSEIVHFQDTCQSDHDEVNRRIHHPGLPKPSLGRIVDVGHAYETLAKEKNYVTGINVMATLRTTTKMKLKRSGEKMRREEEVDVPSEIVAFAHDYASWVAYQSDHESLLRLIVGTNPEDQVYAEDDMMTRRKELCAELKSELGTLLEQSSSVAENTSRNDSSSATRGLGLRWEARAIFLARIVDAVTSFLGKHDQLMLPPCTRLGRVRPLSANVTVCVACDRPMRPRKNPRSHSARPADGEIMKSANEIAEERPHTTTELLQCGSGNASCKIPPRSPSMGQIIKTSRLSGSLKENSQPYQNSTEQMMIGARY